jgi:hypothetical protein
VVIKSDPAYAARVAAQAKRLQDKWAAQYRPCDAVDPWSGRLCRLPLGHRSPDHWASPDVVWIEQ